MEYNVYKLETKPFDKRTFKEFRILAEDKQLKSFLYNKYNYFRVDDRVSKKRIFGWWDKIIPELFGGMTFALSLHDISSMYHHRFESSIWPFRINKYEVEQVVIFDIKEPNAEALTAIYKPSHSCYFIND